MLGRCAGSGGGAAAGCGGAGVPLARVRCVWVWVWVWVCLCGLGGGGGEEGRDGGRGEGKVCEDAEPASVETFAPSGVDVREGADDGGAGPIRDLSRLRSSSARETASGASFAGGGEGPMAGDGERFRFCGVRAGDGLRWRLLSEWLSLLLDARMSA